MRFLGKLWQQKVLSATLLIFTLSIGILIGTLINSAVHAEKTQNVATDATPLTIPNPVELSTAFSQLAKQLEPSVVNITSTYTPQPSQQSRMRRRGQSESPDDQEGDQDNGLDLFRRFFGQDPSDLPQRPFRSRQGTGSGVVVDSNGYILTNFHVVQDATRIQVKFTDDPTNYAAKLIGADPEMDLAVIKVDGKHAQAAKIGNSDAVHVGDWAVAIGSPFGLEATVTAGIISATGRDIGTDHQLQRFIQTDAAINPGNSGGPLLNIRGEVIGINTAIATESGGYQGIGFALPINTAANTYNQLIKTGKVSRGSIGVGFSPEQKPEMLKVYGADHGVFVTNVQPGGPGEKAGMKAEDVIIALNGKPVKDGDDLVARVSAMPVNSDVTVTVLRGGKRMDLKVSVGERTEVWANDPRFQRFRRPDSGQNEGATQVKFGLSIQSLPQGTRDRLGFKEPGGVLITEVTPGSFAEDINMLPRDIIMSINRRPINSVDDVQRVQAGLRPGDPMVFHIMRSQRPGAQGGAANWQSIYLSGTLPANP
jgi:serine protease Do